MYKKLLFASSFLVLFQVKSQENFKIEGDFGISTGEISKMSTFNAGMYFEYRFLHGKQTDLGASVGFTHFFVDKLGTDRTFIPISIVGVYRIDNHFNLNLSAGYFIPTNNSIKSSIVLYPKIGYKIKRNEITLGYQQFLSKHKYGDYDPNTNSIKIKNSTFNFGSLSLGYGYFF